ncbi:hypothetical protein LTR09_012040 [Extremus antarcticus]|uniref:FAD-binding domain-containing protein n=1 Tax=Extremus antarcticus TaxID=702011 RepID=A0AAJ0DAS3_9PEZI|nr:hypothetical protein LTR09_012040 [Extremus antarcticus]
MSANNFRAIVIGGGPVGLTAAHALQRAGIDFLLLERRPHVVIDAGSNLVLNPLGIRALAQLDLAEPLNAVSSPLGEINRLDHNGRDIGDVHLFIQLAAILGIAPRVISRHDLTRVLYDTLPAEAQQKLLGNKKLSEITPTANGVVVTCADGSSYEGSIVIGADGAHSLVRDLMRKLSLEKASSEQVNAEHPFLTTYRALWVRFPRPTAIPVGTVSETHGTKLATQSFYGEETGVIGAYERMEAPTTDRIRYSQEDQEALIKRWGHLPVSSGSVNLTLGDVYDSRLESGLVSLEEGVVENWSWNGRVTLAGDAAHKFTPSTGAGCNNGMVDIVALVTELQTICSKTSDSALSSSAVDSAFRAYQSTRYNAVVSECAGASMATAAATWQTVIHKFVDRRIICRHAITKFLISRGAKSAARSTALDSAASEPRGSAGQPFGAPTPGTLLRAH